ncbi:hemin-degrading factor [Pelagibacterium lentulum]|uniref:Hemin-degrading factor n=1 Tax=Pelagibacterium lentulum TaxID=2029865 RepID=A0A916VV70_9HYPH|nr:ChuX/HutX family heme-like substrate-binding protein [Pelagibacterium lentulum]GGA39023.1 hemin-degrading factor [Pelagibacterium lentulum]
MTSPLTPQDIRDLRAAQPQMRERDFARIHKISEAQLVAAFVGQNATRLKIDIAVLLEGAKSLGTVMALTRNESAVHEKIGPYEKVHVGAHNAMVLGEQIDLRIFQRKWISGFAVTKQTDDGPRHSMQFFDAAGDAVHKIHLRPESDKDAYDGLVAKLLNEDQSQFQDCEPVPDIEAVDAARPQADADALRSAWSKLTDTHQFFGMLRDLNLPRHQALQMAGPDYVRPVETDAVAAMFDMVKHSGVPIMAFVGNTGCIQIHSGPIHKTAMMGPWLNVMDETFHLHLRTDHIVSAYVVRKPTSDGFVTSLETYDENGKLIIQFFGKRVEGHDERPLWREALGSLPTLAQNAAA